VLEYVWASPRRRLYKASVPLALPRAGISRVQMGDLNRTWASLPGSPYGQPTMTMDQAHDTFEDALNSLPECN